MGGGGNFGMLKNRVTGGVIIADDDDAEHQNIIDNLDPTGIGDQSDDNATFQTQVDPYPGSVITKPTTLAGEHYNSRFEIADTKGTTFHYEKANSNINKLFAGETKIVTKTGTYIITTSDGVILANPSSSFTLTLPAVSGNDGKLYYISNIASSAYTVTIDGSGSETVGGLTSRYLKNQGDYLVLVCDEANTDWVILAKTPLKRIPEYKNLVVKNNISNPSYQIDIDVDALDVTNTGNDLLRLISVNLTVDLTTAGANGLDTGSMAVDISYALWVIYNPTTNTTSGLISTSFTFSGLTLPSGYTFGRLVDFCRVATGSTEYLDEVNFATHANWDITGDFDDTGGNAAYTHSAGSGTLTQVNADMANVGVNNVLYIFDYTVSSPSGDALLQITNAFALVAQSLSQSAGSQSKMFLGAVSASTADFVISGTSTSGGITIDDVSLKEASIIPFHSVNGIHLYDNPYDDTQVVTNGTSTAFTDVSATKFCGNSSAFVKQAILYWEAKRSADTAGATYFYIRPNGSSGNGVRLGKTEVETATDMDEASGELTNWVDSSFIFEYKQNVNVSSNLSIWVHGVYLNL